MSGNQKDRISITYKTTVNGTPAVVDLPFRVAVLGDFSFGTSTDRSLDLDKRSFRSFDGNNTNAVMKDMKISIDLVIPNKINPDEESLRVRLPIESINSFSPQEVAKNIPQVRSLLLLKKLLEEIQSNLANKKEFAQLLNKLFSSKDLVDKMKEKLIAYEQGYTIHAKTNK